eukprot:2433683-Rhodomonas_salina.2
MKLSSARLPPTVSDGSHLAAGQVGGHGLERLVLAQRLDLHRRAHLSTTRAAHHVRSCGQVAGRVR